MKTKILILAMVLVLFPAAAGVALANGGLELPRWVLGGGASDSAASDVTLRATLGQPVVGVVSGGDVTLGQGFWHSGSLPEGGYDIYLPLVQR
jgi:hypothetical protein